MNKHPKKLSQTDADITIFDVSLVLTTIHYDDGTAWLALSGKNCCVAKRPRGHCQYSVDIHVAPDLDKAMSFLISDLAVLLDRNYFDPDCQCALPPDDA